MITEGSVKRNLDAISGAQSKRLRTSYLEETNKTIVGPTIQFGPTGAGRLQVPHNDELVITAAIRGYEVKRILVDNESAVDIMTYDCFQMMDPDIELKATNISLYRYNGCEFQP